MVPSRFETLFPAESVHGYGWIWCVYGFRNFLWLSHRKWGENGVPHKQEVRNQCISCFCMIISSKTSQTLPLPVKFITAGDREQWFVPCAAAQSSLYGTPTAPRRRQGGLVKCYFYPEYLNSDDCDSVFDVTWSSPQSADYSPEFVSTGGKCFMSHSFLLFHLWRMSAMQLTPTEISSAPSSPVKALVSSVPPLAAHFPTNDA